MHWINTPCTDPVGRVFAADGRIYRAIFPDQAGLVRSVIEQREVRALMDEGLIARMWACERKVDGFGLVVESEKAPFDVPCERYTRATLRAAALRWLGAYRRLLAAGLVFSDAHFGNTMLFAANEPRWIDLGSIRPPAAVEEERPFRSFRRFWSGMLAPLVLIATQPRHTRLARLSIADQPHQGPLTTADEAPLSVESQVEDSLQRLRTGVAALGTAAALDALGGYIQQLPEGDAAGAAKTERPAAAVLNALAEHFRSHHVASVICLGCDAFEHYSDAWGKADALVIDESEGDLDRLGRGLKPAAGGGQTALYFGHPVNRLFLKAPPAADAVIAVDPLARYAHNSHVAAENLAQIFAALGTRIAVAVTPSGRKAETERMLRHAYPSVTSGSSSWFGSGTAIVFGKK